MIENYNNFLYKMAQRLDHENTIRHINSNLSISRSAMYMLDDITDRIKNTISYYDSIENFIIRNFIGRLKQQAILILKNSVQLIVNFQELSKIGRSEILIEYIITEILDFSCMIAEDKNESKITSYHILLAIIYDSEINNLIRSLNRIP